MQTKYPIKMRRTIKKAILFLQPGCLLEFSLFLKVGFRAKRLFYAVHTHADTLAIF